ncbi:MULTISPECIES: GNAT family N-acetyltransferase [unclassified Mesorhizobium]|uniref:GNAT family N-acetyltransferase n=1 Tax=unclassified Mesorhizobium TaxID=325217 RepID=UPI000FC9CF43|nr:MULTISPECIES: GNAT family N-acetyltransferase [unclassified Mesorhizobium]RUW78044.1 GNAT family N-acetyltransferase [Mesorhizobium sp. M4B.F.Ca.ET.049.02.1.2]TGV26783.1 tetratricopeptide repeat protein [Mesorhizobium sp. M4B.F.Ca.ET.143.01.1.1]
MRVDVIDGFDTLVQLRSNWDAVYAADPEAQYFMSWLWIAGWFKRLRYQWLVLAAREDDSSDYVGFFPLQLRTERASDGAFHNELRTGGGYFAGYSGFLCNPDVQDDVIVAFAETVKQQNWAKLHLENIFMSPRRLNGFLSEFSAPAFLTGKVRRPDDGDGVDHDIYVYVNLPGDWEEFLNDRLGAATRKTARRTLRAIDDAAEYRVTDVTAATLERDLRILLQFWENQWGAKLAARYHPGLPQAMINNFRNMLRCAFEDDALYLPVLWQGENPIGVQATLIDRKNRSLIGMLNGRDLSIRKPAPGFALHLYSIRWAIENGFAVYDLQTGDFAYKYDFGGLERKVECLFVSTATRRNLRDSLERRSLPVVLARAKALRQAGDLDGAVRACRQILSADRSHSGARQLLEQLDAARRALLPQTLSVAARLHQAGNLAEAEKIYREILDVEPRHFDVRYLLGVIFLQQRRYGEAEQQINQAIEIRPDVPAGHYNRGLALAKLDRIEDALASLDNCIELEPSHSQALALRAALARSPQPAASLTR